jgi:uncharacterized protein (UPF0333 family)
MWNGIITINGIKSNVSVYETELNGLKTWYGNGSIEELQILDSLESYETEIGKINIIKQIDKEIQFKGTGVPLVKIN